MMAGLIAGTFDENGDSQSAFFAAHVAPWAQRFFRDLEGAPPARFYGRLGTVGREFLELEADLLL
jgi:TorA maturation chaperone TorD